MPRVPACHRFLSVPACLRAMRAIRAFVLWRASVPTCQRAMACQRASVPACHHNFYVPIFFGVPFKIRRANQILACHSKSGVPTKFWRVPFEIHCVIWIPAYYLYSGILSILLCFEGWKFCPEIDFRFWKGEGRQQTLDPPIWTPMWTPKWTPQKMAGNAFWVIPMHYGKDWI